jgi:colanic acid biosynthesis glycosyl transferase WcaI
LTFLLLNQTFYPDVMATGQYLTEVAVRLVERGHQVTVVTSRRAYDHPETRFPKTEIWRGIRVIRVGSAGFGKGAKWRRAADFATFLALGALRVAFLPRQDVVVALTTPPLISVLGATVAWLRRSQFVYWVMDLNPDEAIAAGWLRSGSLSARLLEWMSRSSLWRAKKVIALDRFMRDRILAKGIPAENIIVIPPWSHDTEVRFDAEGRERFRKAHGLDGKFVVMYSGNHSPVHPLDTLLHAAEQMRSDKGVVFCFVGGGSEWRKIKETTGARNHRPQDHGQGGAELGKQNAECGARSAECGGEGLSTIKHQFSNILCLPYQPLEQLAGSLSAADLHVVVMGNVLLGLVHPCKIYNILSVAAPVLYIGPRPSHLSEILDGLPPDYPCAAAAQGEVHRVVEEIAQIRRQQGSGGRQAPAGLRATFSKEVLLPRLIGELEAGPAKQITKS